MISLDAVGGGQPPGHSGKVSVVRVYVKVWEPYKAHVITIDSIQQAYETSISISCHLAIEAPFLTVIPGVDVVHEVPPGLWLPKTHENIDYEKSNT